MRIEMRLISAHKIGKAHGSWYYNLDFSTGLILRKYAIGEVLIYISVLGFGFRILFEE